jgi:hypothetical protein
MPYERGKLSVALGRLRVVYLNNGIVRVQNTFQLPPGPALGPMVAPVRQGRERRKFDPLQVSTMGKMVQDLGEFDLDFDATNPYQVTDLISGPEFAFHGSKQTWDAIYESGGLYSAGDNTDIGAHVFNSQQAQSAYVSGTRALSVAHSFASGGGLLKERGEYGFVYMFHIEGGIQIGPGHNHRQAEVTGLGKVPIRDILMFKWLAQPRKIYINLDYTATATPPLLLNACLTAIGGGATP